MKKMKKTRIAKGEAKKLAYDALDANPFLTNRELANETGMGYSTACRYKNDWQIDYALRVAKKPNECTWGKFIVGSLIGSTVTIGIIWSLL